MEDVENVVDEALEEEPQGAEDSEFELDEEGNIIIPEPEMPSEDDFVDEDIPTLEEDSDETEDDAEEEEIEESEETATVKTEEVRATQDNSRLEALEKQSLALLKALGVDSQDVLEGLEKASAELEGVSFEEYKQKKLEAETLANAKRIQFEKKMQLDLEEIQKNYPATKSLKSVRDMPNFEKFARARDAGFSAKEAYAAANPDLIVNHVAKAVRQRNLNDSKAHLKSAVPRNMAGEQSVLMSKEEIDLYKELFPNQTASQRKALFKQVIKK